MLIILILWSQLLAVGIMFAVLVACEARKTEIVIDTLKLHKHVLINGIEELIMTADNTGCTPDLTVVSANGIKDLQIIVNQIKGEP